MNKKEFLDVMEQRLSVLEAQEREDMLSEYTQHIEMKMESGMSEQEAIDDFGDIDSLIAEILEAYHIDPSYRAVRQKGVGEGLGRKAGGVITKSKETLTHFMGQQKEKQKEKQEKKREEDKERPSRWKRANGIAGEERQGGVKMKDRIKSVGKKTWALMLRLCVWCGKALLVLLVLPSLVLTLCSVFGFGILAVLLTQGYPLVGAVCILLGCTLGFGAFSLFVLTYVIGKGKQEDMA